MLKLIRFFLIIYLIFLKKIETSNRTVYQDQERKKSVFTGWKKRRLLYKESKLKYSFIYNRFGSIEAIFDHFECGSPWQNQIDSMRYDSMFFQCSFKFHCLSLSFVIMQGYIWECKGRMLNSNYYLLFFMKLRNIWE